MRDRIARLLLLLLLLCSPLHELEAHNSRAQHATASWAAALSAAWATAAFSVGAWLICLHYFVLDEEARSSPTARSCTPGQRAPPWAFTLHRGCSHIPHNVSAHALSSPRGIGILAPAPRCDLRAGGRRTRGRTPPHTLATHRVRTRRARGTLAGSSRSSSLCTTSQQPPRLRAGGWDTQWAAVLRPRLRGHERRVPRGPRPFTTHVTLSHPTYPPRLSRNRVGFLMHNLILSHEFAAGGRRPPCPVAQSVSQLIRGPSRCTTATAPYPLHTSPTPLPAHPVFTRLAWLGGRRVTGPRLRVRVFRDTLPKLSDTERGIRHNVTFRDSVTFTYTAAHMLSRLGRSVRSIN